MPLPSWLRLTLGSSSASTTSLAQLYSQTATANAVAAATNGGWVTTSATCVPLSAWVNSVPCTTPTTTSATTVWCEVNGWAQEVPVEHWQYVSLAHARAAQSMEAEQQRLRAIAEQARMIEAARRMAQEDLERMASQTAADREAALTRSRELLLSHLTPDQRRTFVNNGWFLVEGGATKTRYRIQTRSYTGNIEVLHRTWDDVMHRLCGHLRPNVPLYDHHIAQKISLECDEDAFVRLCNRSAA